MNYNNLEIDLIVKSLKVSEIILIFKKEKYIVINMVSVGIVRKEGMKMSMGRNEVIS